MKRTNHLILLFIFSSYFVYSQDSYLSQTAMHMDITSEALVADHEAFFPGCHIKEGNKISNCTSENLREFLSKRVQYPETAKQIRQEASCNIHFMIGKTGKVTQSVVKHCDEKLFKAAIDRALDDVRFIPAKKNGKYIDKAYAVNIKFAFDPF